MSIFLRAIFFFSLIISFYHLHVEFTPEYHNIIQIYNIIQHHMQLYRNNNIIINAVEHKGIIEEKHSYIETP